MKTAMQEAIEHFENINHSLVTVDIKQVPYILKQFLEKEKQQIIDAFIASDDNPIDTKLYRDLSIADAEQYYKETFKQ